MKNLGINLTRYLQDVFTENYKTLLKKEKSSINGEKPCPWIEKNIAQKSVLKLISSYNAILIKIPKGFLFFFGRN